MEKLRARIDTNPRPLTKLTRELVRRREFVLEGENYVRPKRTPDKLLSEWYNKKTFSLIHEEKITDAVFSPDLKHRLIQGLHVFAPILSLFCDVESGYTASINYPRIAFL
jgi:hypothetical protein